MARITIEDCIEKVPNRFQLVQMAAIRAKQLKRGASSLVERDVNKEIVTALREIAAGAVKPDARAVAMAAGLPAPEVDEASVASLDAQIAAELAASETAAAAELEAAKDDEGSEGAV